MHDAHNTCECMNAPRKNAYALVHARLCTGAEASLPCKLFRTYVESCASIVQAVVCHLLLPPLLLSRLKPLSDAARSRNLSKSTLAHDTVDDVVLHKHHSFICVGAGLIQFVHGSHSHFATEVTSSRILIWPLFCASFVSSVGFQAWDQGILHVWNVWCPTCPSGLVRGVRNAPDWTGRPDGLNRVFREKSNVRDRCWQNQPVWFPGIPRYFLLDNLMYPMDNPSKYPGQIADVSGTWLNFVLGWREQNTY